MKFNLTTVFVLLLMGCTTTSNNTVALTSIVEVDVQIPEGWVKVLDQCDNQSCSKKWEPENYTFEHISRHITEHKVKIPSHMTALDVHNAFIKGEIKKCEEVSAGEVDTINVNDHLTTFGLIICSKHKNEDYGWHSFYRIGVSGNSAFIVSSGIIVPPSTEVGSVSFPVEKPDEITEFVNAINESKKLLRESVTFCLSDGENCI